VKQLPILVNSLLYGGIVTIAIAVLGATIGFLVAGPSGVVSALIGASLAAVFMGLTAASILVAARFSRIDPPGTAYFAIILGAWFLKLVLFLILMIFLRGQHWLNPYVFFGAVLAAVIGSLIADGLAIARTRVPYVGDIALPGQPKPQANRRNGAV
jgi:hypothetical protein